MIGFSSISRLIAALGGSVGAAARPAGSLCALQQLHHQACSHSTAAEAEASSSGRAAADESAEGSALQALSNLPPEQRQLAAALRDRMQRPLRAASDAALLHALSVSYRDLFVIMDQMHKKDILGVPHPLMDDPPASSRSDDSAPRSVNHTQLFYPVRDLTRLPDRPDPGLIGNLQGKFMGSPVAYMQVLPNHLEVSYQTITSIMLWPPMEVFHPFHIDYELAVQRYGRAIRARPGRSGTRRRKKQRKVLVNSKTIGLMPPSS